LEEDFRQTEARVQLEEERHEVDEFMTHVFNPLDRKGCLARLVSLWPVYHGRVD
jgi:hypothetical protein